MTTPNPSAPKSPTLAEIATTRAGAARVLHRHGLDFCCGGNVTLEEACRPRALDGAAILAEIAAEETRPGDFARLDALPVEDVVKYVLDRFHASHRAELPHLLQMARKVETVHGDKASCPKGLAAHLAHIATELESHMQKEEQVLFPLFLSGRGPLAHMPVQIMEMEHVEHGQNLARLRQLAHGYQPPSEACNTWRALYLGLQDLERAVMEHIHIENNILFPRALRS